MLDIQHNLFQIRNEITQITEKQGRSASAVTLVAVSKTKPLELIAEAYKNGQRHFAENYVQEAVEKIHNWNTPRECLHDTITWHFIGKIQSNKCAAIAQNFDWVHSLSSIKHAKRLNDNRSINKLPINVCIQVQIEQATQRNGIQLNEVSDFLSEIDDLPKLNVRGLMCVLPVGYLDDKADYGFNIIRKKFALLKVHNTLLDTLSIGMSGDYQNALRAGSTMLRLGSAIFGNRKVNDTQT